jgi:ABC-type sugar transport system permease subunit
MKKQKVYKSDKDILKAIQRSNDHNLQAYMFILPWLIGFVVFTVGPFFYTMYLSFFDVQKTGLGWQTTFVGFDNYVVAFFKNLYYVPALLEFIVVEVTYVPAIIIASFILAILLNRDLKFRGGFRTIFFLPVIVLSGSVMDKLLDTGSTRLSDFSENIIFKMIMNYNIGAARALLTLFENFTMVLWFTGIPIILFINGLQKINTQLYEAAKIDGATTWQILWKITVPIIKPTALIVTIFTIVQIGMYNINPVYGLIKDSMYDLASGLGLASAYTWVYTLVVLFFVLVALFIFGSREKKTEIKLTSIQRLNFDRMRNQIAQGNEEVNHA